MRHEIIHVACNERVPPGTAELGEDYPDLKKIERAVSFLLKRLGAAHVASPDGKNVVAELKAALEAGVHDACLEDVLPRAREAADWAMVRKVRRAIRRAHPEPQRLICPDCGADLDVETQSKNAADRGELRCERCEAEKQCAA